MQKKEKCSSCHRKFTGTFFHCQYEEVCDNSINCGECILQTADGEACCRLCQVSLSGAPYSKFFRPQVRELEKRMKTYATRIEELEKIIETKTQQIEKLQVRVDYQPGEKGYHEARNHFEETAIESSKRKKRKHC